MFLTKCLKLKKTKFVNNYIHSFEDALKCVENSNFV